jgi:serine protease inhibitor
MQRQHQANNTHGVRAIAVRPRTSSFVAADHPFLFAVVDTASGLVVFLGRVVDPS